MEGTLGASGFFALCFALSLLSALAIAEPGDRRIVAQLVVAGLCAGALKIWLVQHAPQWLDVPPDALKYQRHAEALAAHWRGATVNSQTYSLDGLVEIQHLEQWWPNAKLPYSAVLGTHEWLYAAYLAVWAYITPDWLNWATYSNAAFAALFPAGAFGIARAMGSRVPIATLAGALALVDPSAAVNGAWLLKDTLACWFAIVGIWAALAIIDKPRLTPVLVLAVALGALGAVRFLGFAAVFLAVFALLPVLLAKRRILALSGLAVASLCGLILFGSLNNLPAQEGHPSLGTPLAAVSAIVTGQEKTLAVSQEADMTSSAVDSTVVDWHDRLAKSPIEALATAVARTLFAPYPWVILTDGLHYQSGIELYYLSVALWIVCLPGIFWAIGQAIRYPSFPAAFVGLVLGACLIAYILFLGEWSTRQRVFMLPIFFALAAIGWADLIRPVRYWKAQTGL
jgi:hypothetical protein